MTFLTFSVISVISGVSGDSGESTMPRFCLEGFSNVISIYLVRHNFYKLVYNCIVDILCLKKWTVHEISRLIGNRDEWF